MRTTTAILITAAALLAQRPRDLVTTTPIPQQQSLAVGFLGGLETWNDAHRNVRKVALDLRAKGFAAETFSNRNWRSAVRFILKALDTNHDGHLDQAERANARVVLYGQSLGGDAAIHVARALHKLNIPVLLTVQVDSVGMHDSAVPPNVREAVNYYQRDGLAIQGRGAIRAADPEHTRILGNYARSYRGQAPTDPSATWIRRTLGGGHAKMEMDAELWSEIRGLLLDAAHK